MLPIEYFIISTSIIFVTAAFSLFLVCYKSSKPANESQPNNNTESQPNINSAATSSGSDSGMPDNWSGDCATMYQLQFQDPATTIMEGIFLFNLHLLFVIISIVLLVGWLLFISLQNFLEINNTAISKFTHSNLIEIIWTSFPALLLLSLASPSFSLLYSLDEISFSELTLKILGHQWYWSYETSDFNSCSNTHNLKYSSYMLTNESLKDNSIGLFRNLETNKRIVVPTNTHLRLLITAVDVLHSWTIPSFGTKVDACPGRLNQANLFIKRFGVFFGQCSEICGANHGFMPIVVVAFTSGQYYYLILTNLEF
jgi:cytochrome c oxidase subunit 2